MADGHELGVINASYGICGFTSTLYAVYANQATMRKRLDEAGINAETRLMAEIKTFLVLMKAQGKQSVLDEIEELTQSFAKYKNWTVDSFVNKINSSAKGAGVPAEKIDLSIAMPPGPLMEYLRSVWDFNPTLENPVVTQGNNVIIGLTRSGAPKNRFNNLAHYVYKNKAGKILSWGEEFSDLSAMNTAKGRDYSPVYRIAL